MYKNIGTYHISCYFSRERFETRISKRNHQLILSILTSFFQFICFKGSQPKDFQKLFMHWNYVAHIFCNISHFRSVCYGWSSFWPNV